MAVSREDMAVSREAISKTGLEAAVDDELGLEM